MRRSRATSPRCRALPVFFRELENLSAVDGSSGADAEQRDGKANGMEAAANRDLREFVSEIFCVGRRTISSESFERP